MTTNIYLRGNLRTFRNRRQKRRQDEVDTHDRKGEDNERGRKRKDEVNNCVTADREANVEKVNDRSN